MTAVLCSPGAAENPYQAELARALLRHGYDLRLRPLDWRIGRDRRPEESLVHLHWLSALFTDPRRVRTLCKLGLFARGLHRLQALGVPLVWTVHNLYEHERQHVGLERRLRRWLARRAAALIVHDQRAADVVRREYAVPDGTEVAVVPHGNYIGVYPPGSPPHEARRRLGLDADLPTLLFLGQIRPYKGVLALLDAVAQVGPAVQLIVAGRPSTPALADALQDRARSLSNVRLRLQFVAASEVATHMAACDLFALPHRDALTSGSAVLAMSFARACVAPRTGCFEALLGEAGAFLYDPGQPRELAECLRTALANRDRWHAMGRRNRTAIEPMGWERVAAETAAVYARASRRAR